MVIVSMIPALAYARTTALHALHLCTARCARFFTLHITAQGCDFFARISDKAHRCCASARHQKVRQYQQQGRTVVFVANEHQALSYRQRCGSLA